jgi:tetratricopeptide (TPR) repeat protein
MEPPADEPYRPGREDSGLRMIGSLGRDRAEASGELAQMGVPEPGRSSTQRELVTILPRRITREVPAVAPPAPPPPATTSTTAVEDADLIEAPRSYESQRHIAVVAAGGTRRSSGPSLGAIFLLLLAAVLAAIAIYTRLHRDHSRAPPNDPSVGTTTQPPHVVVPVVAAIDAAPTPTMIDAREISDAAFTAIDAASSPPPPTPTLAPEKLALQLMAQARAALDANQPSLGLDLAARSLRLHRTTNTYVVRARALQTLGRGDDAIADLVAATQLTPSSIRAWEVMGHMLWTLHHWDEARAAMQQYLQLAPDGASAPEFRHRLTEPK